MKRELRSKNQFPKSLLRLSELLLLLTDKNKNIFVDVIVVVAPKNFIAAIATV